MSVLMQVPRLNYATSAGRKNYMMKLVLLLRLPYVSHLLIYAKPIEFLGAEEPTSTWTHPCSCTLIAHESCLLHWIRAAQQDPARAGKALQCPQCGSKYELESDNPWILRFLDHVNDTLSLCGKIVSIAGFTGIVMSVGFGELCLALCMAMYGQSC